MREEEEYITVSKERQGFWKKDLQKEGACLKY